MAGTYTYLVYDLLTNVPQGELGLTRVSFNQILNQVGTFRGTGLFSDPAAEAVALSNMVNEGKAALYVDRDGTLVWGGIIWTLKPMTNFMSQDFQYEVQASEFLSYFDRRRILTTKAYAAQDQLFIAEDVVNYAQSARGGNIGVQVPSSSSGVTRTVTWNSFDFKVVGQALRDLSVQDQGFDLAVDVGYGLGGQPPLVPGKQLSLGYPRRGRVAGSTGLVFEGPGNLAYYSWPRDASAMANTVYELGPGEGPSMLTSSNSVPSMLDAGYPLLEAAFAHKDPGVTQAILDADARADVKAFAQSVVLAEITVRPDMDPVLGQYETGDDVRVRITDPWFPAQGAGLAPGLDTYMRIIRIDVQPPTPGTPETVKLTLGAVPI